jgi:hypothetical protein
MLIKAIALMGYKFDSRDGVIGKIKDFYFDDQHWAIRYLVADTGQWLSFRQVLISPYALLAIDRKRRNIGIDLTKKQIEDGPPLESDKPVSRQFEETYYGHYGWPAYWNGPYMWGYFPNPVRDPERGTNTAPAHKAWDPHLLSTHDVTGHRIQASDGEIGHVKDFIIDDETWAIRYLVIDTGNWWPGKKVLVSPRWIERVSWPESKVLVNLRCETIKQSPEYTDESLPTRDYETRLHRHYNREGYWIT